MTIIATCFSRMQSQTSPERFGSPSVAAALRHTCDACEKEFDSVALLWQHQLLYHGTSQATAGFSSILPVNGGSPHASPTNGAAITQQNAPFAPPPLSQRQPTTPTAAQKRATVHHQSAAANALSQLLMQTSGVNSAAASAFPLTNLFNLGNIPLANAFGNGGGGELDASRVAQQLQATGAQLNAAAAITGSSSAAATVSKSQLFSPNSEHFVRIFSENTKTPILVNIEKLLRYLQQGSMQQIFLAYAHVQNA